MNIYDLTKTELENYLININEKKYKATQIYEWLYQHRVKSFNEMSNLKKELIANLNSSFTMNDLKIELVQESKLVKKFLFKLYDNQYIEAVLMYHDYGLSVCISSEVGCNMGCKFCESGRLKKVRDLTPHEMVLQILLIEEYIKERISSVVIMGIGEPFDNYDNVMKFIRIINDPKGIAIGARHITVSTCGIIPKIYDLIKENIQINLAISLHAPTNEIRNKIMPVNKVYNLSELIPCLQEYISKTNRRVTIEYVMLNNVNDTLDCAKELVHLLKNMNIYVNLIPYNETNNIEFKKSSKDKILAFYDYLKKNNINVTIRKEFGLEIDAACGQLRSKRGEQ